jgi:hypothetical protein
MIVSNPNPHPNTSNGAGDMAAVSPNDIFSVVTGVIDSSDSASWKIVETLKEGRGHRRDSAQRQDRRGGA